VRAPQPCQPPATHSNTHACCFAHDSTTATTNNHSPLSSRPRSAWAATAAAHSLASYALCLPHTQPTDKPYMHTTALMHRKTAAMGAALCWLLLWLRAQLGTWLQLLRDAAPPALTRAGQHTYAGKHQHTAVHARYRLRTARGTRCRAPCGSPPPLSSMLPLLLLLTVPRPSLCR
jgi:hypothetical protein